MKILLATFFTIPQEIGGFWPFISELKTGLIQEGFSVDILGRTADGLGYTLYCQNKIIRSVELLPLVKKQLLQSLNQLPPENYEIQRYGLELAAAAFDLSQYDLIHCQDVIAGHALSRVKLASTPLITSVHGSLPLASMHLLKQGNSQLSSKECEETAIYRYNMALEFAGLQESNLIHTSSIWFRKQLKERYNIPHEKMVTIPYGLRIDSHIKEEVSSLKRNPDKKIIIYTGRLTAIKGISYLIHALFELKKTRSDWECWVIGDGERKEEYISKARELDLLDQIKFFGKRNDVFSLLKKSDIFVLPSLQDNQPYSLMEAQFAGLSSVVTKTGGLPEMVRHGINGLLVNPASHQELFYAMQQLLEQDNLRSFLGNQAKKSAENTWCFQKMIKKIITMYKMVV
ncbi:glycosyltransferase family 4 protein [Fictibacillus iocasae]|uniref:Glycosyltransferase family 4 protein n=1 Tax=Fictibacillus iocasae TaxID=2715437 RepID=A0ABW2NRX3_9BACL